MRADEPILVAGGEQLRSGKAECRSLDPNQTALLAERAEVDELAGERAVKRDENSNGTPWFERHTPNSDRLRFLLLLPPWLGFCV